MDFKVKLFDQFALFRSCSSVRPDYMHFFHSADDTFLPWTGVLSGMFIASIYYWCTDQVGRTIIPSPLKFF